jgi:hypothetical protein
MGAQIKNSTLVGPLLRTLILCRHSNPPTRSIPVGPTTSAPILRLPHALAGTPSAPMTSSTPAISSAPSPPSSVQEHPLLHPLPLPRPPAALLLALQRPFPWAARARTGRAGSWAAAAGAAPTSPALEPPASPTQGSTDGSSRLVGGGGSCKGGAGICSGAAGVSC